MLEATNENVVTVEFWEQRIADARAEGLPVRTAISGITGKELEAMNGRTRDILAKHVPPGSSVIDLACGVGDLTYARGHQPSVPTGLWRGEEPG